MYNISLIKRIELSNPVNTKTKNNNTLPIFETGFDKLVLFLMFPLAWAVIVYVQGRRGSSSAFKFGEKGFHLASKPLCGIVASYLLICVCGDIKVISGIVQNGYYGINKAVRVL